MASQENTGYIEPEQDDVDSALGELFPESDTETLRSSLLQSVHENGRGYHKYKDGLYFMPDDEREQERLDMQHGIFLQTMNNRLLASPIDSEAGLDVLDLGTGTGIWAMDFADHHPQATVLGTDLSPIQPSFVPPNCKFEVDDFDQTWCFSQKFDLIHGRMLAGSVADPPMLLQQAFDAIKPGGWVELQDFAFPVRSDDGTMVGTAFERLNDNLVKGLQMLGRDGAWAANYKDFMEQAGFVNVTEIRYKWPQNCWPKDEHLKRLGYWNMVNTLDGLHAFSARLCTKVLGMSVEEFELLLAESRKDIRNPKIHAYWPM
jgi:SAM-dependent methyltransferase